MTTIGPYLAKLMIVLDAAAGLAYLISGDIRRGIYWITAAILTGSVTF